MVAVMDLPKAVEDDGKRTRQPCQGELSAGGLEMFHWWVEGLGGFVLLGVLFVGFFVLLGV